MKPKSNQNIYYALLFVQGLLSFILGIAGNKIAEIVDLNPSTVLLITVLLIAGTFILTIILLSIQPKSTLDDSTYSFRLKFSKYIPGRIVTMFPTGILIGVIVGAIFIKLIFFPTINLYTSTGPLPGPALYEIFGYIILLISTIVLSRLRYDNVIILTYTIGFAIGISSVVSFLDKETLIVMTYLGWLTASIITALLARSETMKGLIADINDMTSNVTKQRK